VALYWLNQFFTLLTAVYVLLFIVVAGTMLWLPRSWLAKGTCFVLVCILFAMPLVHSHFQEQEERAQRQMIVDRFLKLCQEQAGEKIYKVVDGVEGFLILKPRKPTRDMKEYRDQYWMGDPYGHSDLEAEKPEHVFLADRRAYDGETIKIRPIAGYNYIEIQLKDYEHPERYKRIEVVARISDKDGDQLETHTEHYAKARSRYAYDWEDISTEEDRKYWIAGGRMRVIDLPTKEVVAERTGYMIDMGQGATEGGRKPWLVAYNNACPRFESEHTKAQEFVSRALKVPRRIHE
jgi:hypothetical protein